MHRRICLIPLDSRPVCYDLPRRLAAMAGIELCMPSPKLLGGTTGDIKTPADLKALQRWVKNHLIENDPVIVALDTVAYGGLIPSRVGDETLALLDTRLQKFFDTVKASTLFGFSSILRIPSYNGAEEEPEYWARYGKVLFQYSTQLHQAGAGTEKPDVPPNILEDFLQRRARNFALNRAYIDRLQAGKLDYLVFCQDDTGPYGLNVQEAQQLEALLTEKHCQDKGHLQTGADEVASSMLARWFSQQHSKPMRVYPLYSAPEGRAVMAKFDGIPIEALVERQLNACGAVLAEQESDADLWLIVHTPEIRQGDHCENQRATVNPQQWYTVLERLETAFQNNQPVVLADIANANGSDPELTSRFLQKFSDLSGLYGYAGWNTPGNTLGTALAMGILRFLAERQQRFNRAAFEELMLIRLGDDWLYQSEVRGLIRSQTSGMLPDARFLNAAMGNGLALLQDRLHLTDRQIQCRFPCQRTFEIEIGIR